MVVVRFSARGGHCYRAIRPAICRTVRQVQFVQQTAKGAVGRFPRANFVSYTASSVLICLGVLSSFKCFVVYLKYVETLLHSLDCTQEERDYLRSAHEAKVRSQLALPEFKCAPPCAST